MGGGGGTPLGPLLGPRPPMINNILGSDYPDYPDVSTEYLTGNEDFVNRRKMMVKIFLVLCLQIPELLYIGEAKRTNNEEKPQRTQNIK